MSEQINSPIPATQRIPYVDVAKAICIFLMVVGHWSSYELLTRYIYSFHMPALFIISGMLYKPHSWRKTILAFSIPVLFFSLINLVVKLSLGEMSIASITFPSFIFQILHYRYGLAEGLFVGDWFLWALIGMRFLFGDINCLKPLRNWYVPIMAIAFIYMTFEKQLISVDTLFRGYYIGRMVPSLPFFCLGLYLKDKKWNPHDMIKSYSLPILILAFLFLPLLNTAYGINDNDYGISYCVYWITAVLSSLLLFWFSGKVPSSKYVETISKGTLVVLGIHSPILHILHHILPEDFNIFFPLITIVLCYYIIIFCEKYCPFFLGKGIIFPERYKKVYLKIQNFSILK